jgi:heteromeric Ino2p/Ino4p transcription factor
MSSPVQNKAEKQRLSEVEKKSNHIASEKRRRSVIRKQCQTIAEMVPGLEDKYRSEAQVMEGAKGFIEENVDEQKKLLEKARRLGLQAEQYDSEKHWRYENENVYGV